MGLGDRVSGAWELLVTLLPVAAGIALAAIGVLAIISRPGRGPRVLPWTAATAAAAAGVLFTNWLLLRATDVERLELWLFLRACSLSALLVLVVVASSTIADQRPPGPVVGVVGVLAATRIVLWEPTDLFYGHELIDGVPQYGPLLGVTAGPALLIVAGHLLFLEWRAPRPVERVVFHAGSAGAVVVGGLSLVVAPVEAEIVTGYVPVPILAALYALALARIRQARHAEAAASDLRKLRDRQRMRDSLTGLPDRAALPELVEGVSLDSHEPSHRCVVLLVDIDEFKAVNDARGYGVGDEILAEIAHRLALASQGWGQVCRFGGDEFAVVFRTKPDGGGGANSEVVDRADRLLGVFAEPFEAGGHSIRLTASIGIAVGGEAVVPHELVRDADIALHRAKREGGHRVEFSDLQVRDERIEEVEIRDALVQAVDRDEIVVHYQPVVDLITGQTVGVEALTRWDRDGIVHLPATWLTLAERTGLIDAIGAAVLQRVAIDTQDWVKDPEFSIAVNVSPLQLRRPSLSAEISALLGHSPIRPSQLILEVTETAVVSSERALHTLNELHELGIRIALDDFGVEYSSLGAIDRLPIDILKIDKQFTHRLDRPDGEAVVRAVLALASSLELAVVIEGVETDEQQHRLIALGGRVGQGFLFGKPDTPAAIDMRLHQQAPTR